MKKQKAKPPAPPTSKCLNSSCGKPFVAGHYGKLQRVGKGKDHVYLEKCSKKCPGKTCKKCAGKGSYESTCTMWYRRYWSQVRKPPRGMSDEDRKRLFDINNKIQKDADAERAKVTEIAKSAGAINDAKPAGAGESFDKMLSIMVSIENIIQQLFKRFN